MARQPIHSPSPFRISQAPSLHNTFLRGLITEVTEVGFPDNAVTDTADCIFSPVGFVSRRLGLDYEAGYVTNNLVNRTVTEATTEFVWNAVAGDGTISFLVQQIGTTISFYDLSTSVSLSSNLKSFTINLKSYLPSGSGRDPTPYPCQYASGRGVLVIVNRVTTPIYVIYNFTSGSITATGYELLARDFVGMPDNLTVNQRPNVTTVTLKTTNPNHYYNLLNQGWGEVNRAALTAWDAARSGGPHDSPSDADYVLLYRASPTSIFDNNRVLAQDPLTTPAAKGHYVLNVCNPNRNAAMSAEGFSDVNLVNPNVLIGQSVGTIVSNGYTNTGAAFDGTILSGQRNVNGYAANSTAFFGTGFIGKNYSSPQRISEAIVYGTNDAGFINNSVSGSEPGVFFFLQASQTAPVNFNDGTNIGTTSITNAPNESGGVVIQSTDLNTFWNYVWVYITSPSGSPIIMVTELQFYIPGAPTGTTIPNTTERASTVCFFAGRLFYAGINALQLNNTIFFTQILTQESQYGQCYQVNDPTNETVFALLPSDGGTIAIPEIGSIRKLFTYQNALLIFASNGVWMLTGGSSGGFGGGFTANDFFVKKLSSVGMNAPLSVVDRRGVPMWIGEDGVYQIEYNAQFNSFNVINVTFKTIKTFFLNIPHANQQYIKSTYDPVFDVCYWLYNSTNNPTIPYSYTNVLLFNGIISAFYPWTISFVNFADPQVRGIVAVADAARNNLTHVKFLTTLAGGAGHGGQSVGGQQAVLYSEASNSGYQDWITAGLNYNYSSFLKTSYKLDTQGQRYVQLSYVWVYLEHLPGSSMFVQGLFDFANNANSGKWSAPQQAYNQSPFVTNNFAVDVKRLKLRGKGRSIQLQFLSDTNKPFQVQGWAIHDTMTMGV